MAATIIGIIILGIMAYAIIAIGIFPEIHAFIKLWLTARFTRILADAEAKGHEQDKESPKGKNNAA